MHIFLLYKTPNFVSKVGKLKEEGPETHARSPLEVGTQHKVSPSPGNGKLMDFFQKVSLLPLLAAVG